MEYEEFIEAIRSNVAEKMGKEYKVEYNEMLKNNSCIYKGIIISSVNDSETVSASPSIYLESFYNNYLNGVPIEEMTEEIVNIYHNCNKHFLKMQAEDISKEKLPERIFYRLVNMEMNAELLRDSPYIPFMDMALTFHYLCFCDNGNIQSFRITDDLMEEWGYSVDELFRMADDNMNKLFPDRVRTLESIISDTPCNTDISEPAIEMYVLTNQYCINGAAAMLYTTKLQELAYRKDTDIFILPSSIHEVIMVPVRDVMDGRILRNMVKDVNRTQVIPEDRLSDNIYIYSHTTGKIDIFEY